ncbi:putative pentatricopeptide repeat-containing protein At5g65820 [Raphanus sativus]|uniref:Pentatricopeptide repeat-containing protein At5g65820 n=1 Tax=Raphanus sativus TaxID=3726 RepID=A0A9W3CJ17_RAPSA|nr:putative pentatricopeptide repeat-containing protein At5g65820 [Raphanus sativus]
MTKIISKMQRFGAVWSIIEEMRKENSHLIEPELFAVLVAEGVEITYVSAIKLIHEKTKFRLHSHDVPYGSGSGQQSVTGFPGVVDSTSYWDSYSGINLWSGWVSRFRLFPKLYVHWAVKAISFGGFNLC